MGAAIPPLPHTSLWRSSYLSTETTYEKVNNFLFQGEDI